MSDEIKINKKVLIISLITILLIGSGCLIVLIKPIPFVSAIPQCTGEPEPCEGYEESQCNDCGCDWTESPEVYVNVADSWEDVELIYVNVADAWQSVETVRVNIADTWQTITIEGECGGEPTPCSGFGEQDCEPCGCFWSGEP